MKAKGHREAAETGQQDASSAGNAHAVLTEFADYTQAQRQRILADISDPQVLTGKPARSRVQTASHAMTYVSTDHGVQVAVTSLHSSRTPTRGNCIAALEEWLEQLEEPR